MVVVRTIERKLVVAPEADEGIWTPEKIREVFSEDNDSCLVIQLLKECERLEAQLTAAEKRVEKSEAECRYLQEQLKKIDDELFEVDVHTPTSEGTVAFVNGMKFLAEEIRDALTSKKEG